MLYPIIGMIGAFGAGYLCGHYVGGRNVALLVARVLGPDAFHQLVMLARKRIGKESC